MWYIWLILAGVFLIGEVMTAGFLIFWLSVGSLIAMIVSFFTDSIIIQTSIFVISSVILIFATKPFVKKFAKVETVLTNAKSIIGKKVIVTVDIDSIKSTGQVKIDGEIWSAIGEDETDIPKGAEIEVLEIKGVKVIVRPIKQLSSKY